MQRFRRQITAYLFLLSGVSGGQVLFVRENIAVTVLPPDTVMVCGGYFFSTGEAGPVPAQLYYPFPVDSSADYPCFIKVTDNRTAKDMAFNRSSEGISFSVGVTEGDTAETVVVYKQHVKNRNGRYILTTTSAWGRPLTNSRYSVRIPTAMTLTYMSYECDSVVATGDHLVYHFFKKEFMPNRDLSFTWNSPR